MRKKLLSILLSVCMVLTMLPISAMAEDASTPIESRVEIIAFAPLDEEEKSVSTGTSMADLGLPESLRATVRTAVTADIPVTWTSEPEYDMDTEGVYVFAPVIEGYTVSAELPEITITVGVQPRMMMRMGTAATYGDFSVTVDEDGAAPIFDSGVLTFTAAGEYTVGMAAGKTSTSNVIVVSGAEVTLNLDGVTINAPDGFAAKVDGGNAFIVTSDSVILNLLKDSSFTGGIGGIVDPMNACNGGSGISGNVTLTGTATLTATGGIGGAAAMGDTGTGGIGISGNLTVTGSATVSATGGDGAPMVGTPGIALGGTLTATGFIIKGGFTGFTDAVASDDYRLNQFRYLSVEPAPNVAEIGSTGYPTLQAAVDEVDEGQIIKLTDDITITDSSSITISGANSFTLDLNGKTLDGSSGSVSLIKHIGSGTLTVVDSGTGGKITSGRTASSGVGTVQLYNGNGALTILSGTIENTSTNGAGILNSGTGTVSIQDGAVKANECGVNNKSGNVSVSGGEVSANKNLAAAILSSAGKVTLSGGKIYNPTYVGIGLSNSSLFISGGSPIIQGGVAAMNVAPTVDIDTIGKVIASTSYDGSNPVANYNASQITSYKYLTFAVKTTPTAAQYAAASPAAVSDADYVLDTSGKTLTIKTAKGAAWWSANGATYLDYTIKLTADIDVSDFLWTPVGNDSGVFGGTFDGQGHSLSGLTITAANGGYAGLFGSALSATIQNLCVSGTIEVTKTGGSLYMGGFAGGIGGNSTIRNCCSHVDIQGAVSNGDEVNAGGIVGYLSSGTIENCFNTGDVSGTGADMVIAGGIYGANSSYASEIGTVKNSYNTGSVTGSGSSITWLGALAGSVGNNIVFDHNYYLSGTANAASGVGSRTGYSSFEAGAADGLLTALNGWVSDQASTAYSTWQADNADSHVNGGWPVFGAAWTAPPAPTIGTLSISDSFTAGNGIQPSGLTSYKPTVTSNGVDITAEGWQSSITFSGDSDDWENWPEGTILSPTTTRIYKLRYYVTYGSPATTITSNEVTLNVVGNTTTLVLTESPASQQIIGSSVTLTATLTGYFTGPGVNGQAITFKNGGTNLGTATLNASGVAVFTWAPDSTGTYTLTAEYAATAYNTAATSSTVNYRVIVDPDIAIVAAAKTAAQNASYANMTQAAATDEDAIKAALKSTAETAINNSNITITINKVSYIPPIAGTSANPGGTNGSYTFTVTVSKGSQSETTVQKTITITATPYTGGIGGNGDNGGGSNTPAPSTKPTEPVTGSTENKAAVDGNGNANVSLTDRNITDAIADAKAEAAKKGVNAGDITAVIHVTTGGKDANTVTVNLPKTTQEQVIGNKIASVELVIDRPDLTIGINLAAVTEINRQAQANVQLSATRINNSILSGDAKDAIGNRPAFDLKATYGSGKSVTDFGKGSVRVEIPYTLQKDEIAGNVYAVYVDEKGKVTYLADSSYDVKCGTVVFSTNHFSTYGVAYKASSHFTDIDGHWAEEDILFVTNRGLMNGTSATTFSPNGSMTRGMFVTALGRLANADTSTYKRSSFTDVKADAYYMGYIQWGVKNNILVGIGGGKFDPDGLVTREQMAVIMDRYATTIGFKLPEAYPQNTFADNAKMGAWAAPAIKRIQMAGILQGKGNNLYDPLGTATRAEAAAMLRRFVDMTPEATEMKK